jgi:hypothetical protein
MSAIHVIITDFCILIKYTYELQYITHFSLGVGAFGNIYIHKQAGKQGKRESKINPFVKFCSTIHPLFIPFPRPINFDE